MDKKKLSADISNNAIALNRKLKKRAAGWQVDPSLLPDKRLDEIIRSHGLGSLHEKVGEITASLPRMRLRTKRIAVFHTGDNALSSRSARTSLPSRWDWRDVEGKNYVSTVKNQGSCGSCAAFAVAAATESHYRIERGRDSTEEPLDLSEASLFFTARRQCNIGDPRRGWRLPTALRAAMDEGFCMEDQYPYKPVNQAATIPDGGTRVLKIRGYDGTSDKETMKRMLVEQGPLVGDFTVYEDFYLFFYSAHDQVYKHVSGKSYGGHAVCIIGYDDDRKAWICKNSWGGNKAHPDGCFLIGYGECKIDSRMYIPQGVYDRYTEDVQPYNPGKLHILHQEDEDLWILTDGDRLEKPFASREDARNALRIARRHNQHCFIGRDNPRENKVDYIFEFWTGNSGLSYEPITEIDVVSYEPTKVVAKHLGDKGWRIQEGAHLEIRAHDMDDAMAILQVVERYKRIGFIGRENERSNYRDYIMTYFE